MAQEKVQSSITTDFFKGAAIGGTLGLVLATVIKKRYFLLILSGFCIGGYVSTTVANTKKEFQKNKSEFQNFSSKNRKRHANRKSENGE